MGNRNNLINEIEKDRDKLLYPNELHTPIFILGKEYKNLKTDDIGNYIDRSNNVFDIRVRPPKTPLNDFDNKVFMALLHIALIDENKTIYDNGKGIHNAVIKTKTTYYHIAKILELDISGKTYEKIKKSLNKLDLTIISINYKDKSLFFDNNPLVKISSDNDANIIFYFNQILSKNIIGEFEPNYTLLHINDFTKLENKASSILIPYLKTLNFNNKAIKLTTIIKSIYGLDDETYNNLHRRNIDKYLNNIINSLLELINNENKEPIINNIELVIKSPKNESYIIVKK